MRTRGINSFVEDHMPGKGLVYSCFDTGKLVSLKRGVPEPRPRKGVNSALRTWMNS